MTLPDPSTEPQEAAQRAVSALIGSAREGHGGALVVRGRFGDDLSHLADDGDEGDASRIVRVVPAAPGGDDPIAPEAADLRTIVRALLAESDEALAPVDVQAITALIDDDRPAPDRFTLAVTLHRMLTTMSADHPLTLVVDHAEHLDDLSATALVFVARRIADDPIAIVLNRFETDGPSPLDDLALVEAGPWPPAAMRAGVTATRTDVDSVQALLHTAEVALDAALMDAATVAVDRLAFSETDGSDRARRHLAEGRLALLQGDGGIATVALQEAIDAASRIDTPAANRTATQARLELLQVYLRAGRIHLASGLADELASVGGPHAALAITATRAASGEHAAVRTINEQAEQVIAEGGISEAGFVADTAGLALVWSEHYDAATRLLDRLARTTRRAAAIGPLPTVLAVQSLADLRRSRYPSAAARADEAVRFADATGRPGLASFPGAVLAVAEAVRGDEAGCRLAASRLVDQAARSARSGSSSATEVPARAAMGLLHLGLNRPEQSVAQLEPLVARSATTPWLVMRQMDLAEALARSGRRSDAERLTDQFVAGLGSVRNARARAAVSRSRALIIAAEDPVEAERLLSEAELGFRASGPPFGLARTLLVRGQIRRANQRSADARADLDEAVALLRTMGASGWAAQAGNEIVALDQGSVSIQSGHSVPLAALLTPQELQVAGLVAGGMSNKEVAEELFVSARTVESHLGRIYRKLDLRSRNQLTARAEELGLRELS